MFLKRIDVTGFKSFANRTEIDFAPGVTAVVGPNGSGKSNITDAIRWVLGEQSARSLRGSKMEDVIFAGSDSRKAINFCEVSLTLDNADGHLPVVFEEVTVTRRVYRSGESEYLLNKQSCRLKDISELFMDSGLGRESYSIVGQGKIEEMLSTRPEERRGAFEDAAGIVKFKFRKREAERRLDETEQNLLRVDDILEDLEQRAGPLEVQATRARKYKELSEEYHLLDIGLLVMEIEDLTQRWKQAQAILAEAVAHKDLRKLESEDAEQQAVAQRRQLDERREVANSVQAEYVEAVEKRQLVQGQLDLFKERLANGERNLAERNVQLQQVTEERNELQGRREEYAKALQKLVARCEVKAGELEAASSGVDPQVKAELEQELSRLNSDYIELHQQSASYRNEVKTAEEYFASDVVRKDRVVAERDRLTAEQTRWNEHLTQNQALFADHTTQITMATRELDELAGLQRQQAKTEADCVASLHLLESEIASLSTRRELLSELESGYDGYALGAKTVLQAADKGRLHGVHGAVAGLIRVEKQFEVAVETALGGALQNLVVGTEADARAAIDLLKQRHAGRATLLPLSVIRGRLLRSQDRAQVADHAGFLGLANEVVETDDAYRLVFDHLLGNVVVADTLRHANELAGLLGYRVRIVSLEGDVVSPGGAMTGGSIQRKGPGLLGRSRELKDVEQRMEGRLSTRDRLRSEQMTLRSQLESAQSKQKKLVQTVDGWQAEAHRIQSEISDATTRLDAIGERLQTSEWELADLTEGKMSWLERAEKAQRGLVQATQQIADIETQMATQRRVLLDREETLAAAQKALTILQVEVATLEQERKSVEQQESDVSQRIARLAARSTQLQQEISELQMGQTRTSAQQGEAQQGFVEVSEAVVQLDETTQQVREDLQNLEAAVTRAEAELRQRRENVVVAEAQVHRAEIQVERIDVELNHALNRMGESHRMTFEWAREHHGLTVDKERAKERADKLRREISAMGDVNTGAIEEWGLLSERLQFLTRERLDLRDAKLQLESVVQELDGEMAKRFEEAFRQIRLEFQVSFRQLFDGGRADLVLTDPDDLLSTGIEVTAQPPGKSLQNLNLLSGGERALTAMALLFAILKVRPVPFCVLDEVEAALDEANVSRFAVQLRSFAHDTQFIVITHRRGTMEEADALYGVTMQESGVSSLIGVRLEETDMEGETA